MNSVITTINAKYQDVTKFWLMSLSTYCPIPLFFFLDKEFGNMKHIYLIVVFIIIPLALIRPLERFCTRNVRFKFYDEYFTFEIFKREKDEPELEKKYFYDQLESALVPAPSSNSGLTAVVTLKFLNGEKFHYALIGEEGEDGEIPEYSISETIYIAICSYRRRLGLTNHDILVPHWIMTKFGLGCVVLLTVVTLITVGIHLHFDPKTLFVLAPSLVLYAKFITGRRENLASYQKMKDF